MFAFALALAAGIPAGGAPAPGLDCGNSRTQADMNACSQREAQDAERKLNRAYARLRLEYQGSSLLRELSAAPQPIVRTMRKRAAPLIIRS